MEQLNITVMKTQHNHIVINNAGAPTHTDDGGSAHTGARWEGGADGHFDAATCKSMYQQVL